MDERRPDVSLRPVDAGSWRDVAGLTVVPGQERFVDAACQGRGMGRAMVRSLGFVETAEVDEGEVVARLDLG